MEKNRAPTSFILGLGLVIIGLLLASVFFVSYSPRSERPQSAQVASPTDRNESGPAESGPPTSVSSESKSTSSPLPRQEYLYEQERQARQIARDRYTEQRKQTGQSGSSKALPSPASTPLTVPASRENILRTDRALAELEWGNIAFTAPSSIQLEEIGEVQLLLGLSQSIEELKKALEEQAVVEGAKVRVSDHMEAILSGAGFEIIPITPTRQAVSEKDATEWKWEVKAREPGRRRLHLSLNAVLSGEPNGSTRLLRTFDKDIEVTVTLRQRLAGFITAHEFGSTFIAGILVVAVGWSTERLVKRLVERRRSKRSEEA